MPVISTFFGIVIYMYWKEREPPRFYAKCQGEEISVEIQTGLVTGNMNQRSMRLVDEWRLMHIPELMENWRFPGEKRMSKHIQPLELS